MIQLRIRGPSGQATLKVEPSSSVADFLRLLAEKSGVQPHEQELLSGFPPQPLQLPEDRDGTAVAALGIQSGDSLTVTRAAKPLPPPPATAAAAAAVAADLNHFSVEGMDEDEQLARALALSMEDGSAQPAAAPQEEQQPQHAARSAAAAAAAARFAAAPPAPAAAAKPVPVVPQRPQQARQASAPRAASPVRSHPATVHGLGTSNGSSQKQQHGAPISVAMRDGSAVVRRVIASDNSCLFNAVGYVMEHTRAKAPALRRLIAQQVAADPFEWNEAVLGKPADEYCSWIQQPDKWGGAIELSILSKHYQREIAAFDIQTKRVDIYGQDGGYAERALVIYDGLHYDALAVAAHQGASEASDVTVLPSSGDRTDEVMAAAAQLVAKAHEMRQFTDTAHFTLRCGICQLGFKGEKEAVAHAKETGHTNFSEY
ncbi:hypothetical protein N2152v2_007105 [Parachlorella kessleri]